MTSFSSASVEPVLPRSLEMAGELLGVAASDQRGDGDQASVSG